MDPIIAYYEDLGLDFPSLAKFGGILLAGLLLSLLLGRFIFGRHSNVHCAVSSAIAIIFTYCAVIAIYYAGPRYEAFLAPTPFVEIKGQMLWLFQFSKSHYTLICSQVVRMITLAFLVNVIDRWMPGKRNLFAWLFFRVLTVITALTLHLIVCALFEKYLPQTFITYAPAVLLGLLVLLLLTGALKLLVGILLTSVSPVIAGLYTFFFSTVVGKLLTRALLTTGLLALFSVILSHFGLHTLSIAGSAIVTYLPFLGLLLILWYFITDK